MNFFYLEDEREIFAIIFKMFICVKSEMVSNKIFFQNIYDAILAYIGTCRPFGLHFIQHRFGDVAVLIWNKRKTFPLPWVILRQSQWVYSRLPQTPVCSQMQVHGMSATGPQTWTMGRSQGCTQLQLQLHSAAPA